MSDKPSYDEVLKRVKAINEKLLRSGMVYREVHLFWEDVIKTVRTDFVMGEFHKGKNDNEIAREIGYSSSVVQKITTTYFEDKRKQMD